MFDSNGKVIDGMGDGQNIKVLGHKTINGKTYLKVGYNLKSNGKHVGEGYMHPNILHSPNDHSSKPTESKEKVSFRGISIGDSVTSAKGDHLSLYSNPALGRGNKTRESFTTGVVTNIIDFNGKKRIQVNIGGNKYWMYAMHADGSPTLKTVRKIVPKKPKAPVVIPPIKENGEEKEPETPKDPLKNLKDEADKCVEKAKEGDKSSLDSALDALRDAIKSIDVDDFTNGYDEILTLVQNTFNRIAVYLLNRAGLQKIIDAFKKDFGFEINIDFGKDSIPLSTTQATEFLPKNSNKTSSRYEKSLKPIISSKRTKHSTTKCSMQNEQNMLTKFKHS